MIAKAKTCLYLILLKLFMKKEEIVDRLESVLVKSFIDHVEFDKIKDLSDNELKAFVLYYCLFFTEPYSWFKSIREDVIELSYTKCLRRAKWEVSLLQ